MSVEVTKLPSGLTIITDTMAASGDRGAPAVWAGVGGRDLNEAGRSTASRDSARTHGVQGHRAWRSSREIVSRKSEAVGGGDLQCRHFDRDPRPITPG